MASLVEKARQAARQVVGEVGAARDLGSHPTGERVFSVTPLGGGHPVTVTLNPNGLRAGVEYRCPNRGSGYRVLTIQGNLEPEAA